MQALLRMVPAAAAAGALVVGCTWQQQAAPQIRQDSAALPCPPEPGTTLAMLGCAQEGLRRTDAANDARSRAILRLLTSRARRSFARAEHSWLAYRNAV